MSGDAEYMRAHGDALEAAIGEAVRRTIGNDRRWWSATQQAVSNEEFLAKHQAALEQALGDAVGAAVAARAPDPIEHVAERLAKQEDQTQVGRFLSQQLAAQSQAKMPIADEFAKYAPKGTLPEQEVLPCLQEHELQ